MHKTQYYLLSGPETVSLHVLEHARSCQLREKRTEQAGWQSGEKNLPQRAAGVVHGHAQ